MGRLFYVFVHLVEQYCKTSDIPGNYLTSFPTKELYPLQFKRQFLNSRNQLSRPGFVFRIYNFTRNKYESSSPYSPPDTSL